jgi:apolipoprotein N-acyltransferase
MKFAGNTKMLLTGRRLLVALFPLTRSHSEFSGPRGTTKELRADTIGRRRLAFLSALLLIPAFPKFDLEFLAWVALVPLFIALKDQNLKSAFGLSFLTGICFLMGIFYWINVINNVTLIHFILLGVYFGAYFGLFGLALNFISRRTGMSSVFIAPLVWVSMEYLRSHAGVLGLPWALLGHSQYLNLPLIQISSFTGVYGVSFLIVMVNAALSEVILSSQGATQASTRYWPTLVKAAIVPVFLLGATLIYGFSVISERVDRETISISVIQANIPLNLRMGPELRELNLQKHIGLSKEAAARSQASLIVWPETAVQGSLTQNANLLKMISTLAKEAQSHLLIGVSMRQKFGSRESKKKNRFNSAFLVSPSGRIVGRYNKIHVLPFGEYLPYKDFIPWPSSYASLAGDVMAGEEITLFDLNNVKFGVAMCWESIFPDLFRQFVKNGATFMVNITNEAWFEKTAAPYQFMAMTVFRAVENRVSIARAANTGISGFIDPYGRVIGKVSNGTQDIFVEGYLTTAIPISEERTFYTNHGDVFAYTNLVATFLALGLSLMKARIV